MQVVGFIYKITNLVNGKNYIGLTTKNPPIQRFFEHCRGSSNLVISRSIKKYGAESFCFDILQECYTLDELNGAEIKWIKDLNSLSPNGYNMRAGGEFGGKMLDETKRKLSILNKGKKLTDDQKQKIKNGLEKVKEELVQKTKEAMWRPEVRQKQLHIYHNKGGKSKYCGVTKHGNRWKARITHNNKRIGLGCYATEEEAALVYNEFIIENGLDRLLNDIPGDFKIIKKNCIPPRGVSGYYCVYFDKRKNKWRTRVRCDGKTISLGFFDNVINAAKEYNNYVILNNLKKPLNIIEEKQHGT